MKARKRHVRNRNRCWDAPTHVWVLSTRLAGVVVLVVFFVVTRAVLRHHCRELNRDIARLESQQRQLLDDLKRERAKWSALKAPGNLVAALNRHGIATQHPAEHQLVLMTSGPAHPHPGGTPETAARPSYALR
jgi:hypothetical protein